MDRVEALEFARQIINVSNAIEQIIQYDVRIIDNTILKIRLYLTKTKYVDVFYNADSGRVAYALIQGAKGCLEQTIQEDGIYIHLIIQNLMFHLKRCHSFNL